MKRSFFLLIMGLLCTIFVCSCGFKSRSSVLFLSDEALIAETKAAVMGQNENAVKEPFMVFRFTEKQKEEYRTRMQKNYGEGLKIHLSALNSMAYDADSRFEFAVFDSRDVDDGKLLNIQEKNSLDSFARRIYGKYETLPNGECDLVITLNSSQAPEGFIVYSNIDCSVDSIDFVEKQLGFNLNNGNCLYAFGESGGEVFSDLTCFDFSSAGEIFSSGNSQYSVMPYFTVGFVPAENIGTWDKQKRCVFEYDGEYISVRRSISIDEVTIQTSSLNGKFSKLSFTENSQDVNEILLKGNPSSYGQKNGKVLDPFYTDLGMILNWPIKNWRNSEYELYQWTMFPDVFFLDFIDYNIQNQFFTRMAYFVEKAGYKGTFISDEQVNTLHGYNAHDYKAVDLARFFTEANRQNFKLNYYELLLRDILVHNGIILDEGNGNYSAGRGCIISIARESAEYLRAQLMAHESYHGIYFSDEGFRNHVEQEFNILDPVAWDFIQIYFTTQPSLNYDIEDQFLIRNEFMAYMMQLAVTNIKDYYLTRARWASVQKYEKAQADYIIATDAQDFYDAAVSISDYAFKTWGLCAGRVSLISRIEP